MKVSHENYMRCMIIVSLNCGSPHTMIRVLGFLESTITYLPAHPKGRLPKAWGGRCQSVLPARNSTWGGIAHFCSDRHNSPTRRQPMECHEGPLMTDNTWHNRDVSKPVPRTLRASSCVNHAAWCKMQDAWCMTGLRRDKHAAACSMLKYIKVRVLLKWNIADNNVSCSVLLLGLKFTHIWCAYEGLSLHSRTTYSVDSCINKYIQLAAPCSERVSTTHGYRIRIDDVAPSLRHGAIPSVDDEMGLRYSCLSLPGHARSQEARNSVASISVSTWVATVFRSSGLDLAVLHALQY